MTETSTVSPDGPAFQSTPNESSAATPKLDTQRELDRRQEPPPTSLRHSGKA
jgi:hypothetical protein